MTEIVGIVSLLLVLLTILLINARFKDFFDYSKETVHIKLELDKMQQTCSDLEGNLRETDEILLGLQGKVANLQIKEGLAYE